MATETVSKIERETVLHVAKLARLALSEDEIPRLAADLQAIVGYFDTLAEVDTESVPETANVTKERMPLRDDTLVPSLPRAQVLHEAARSSDEGFTVPGFVDE